MKFSVLNKCRTLFILQNSKTDIAEIIVKTKKNVNIIISFTMTA